MEESFKYLIDKNFERLSLSPYVIDEVFREKSYSWPGDHEGRALLAFCLHYGMGKRKVPQFDEFWKSIPEHLNEDGSFGSPYEACLTNEQQLAGNSWFLRGLLAHHQFFHDEKSAEMANKLVKNLYLPALIRYGEYPIKRNLQSDGGVYGEVSGIFDGWQLSSDVGCLFISLDGLCHFYAAFPDPELLKSLDKAVDSFMAIDKVAMKMQTHATLSGTRGIFELYKATKDEKYLKDVEENFALYLDQGMALDYENFNWFSRPDTWTEPCCVVDSLILAVELFRATGDDKYRRLARRIFFGGFMFSIRPSGGAGPNTCVTKDNSTLRISMDEACQCCTMRLAEGLYCYQENLYIFCDEKGNVRKEGNRYFDGDKLLALDLEGVFINEKHYSVDGLSLIAIPNLVGLTWEAAKKARLQIIF